MKKVIFLSSLSLVLATMLIFSNFGPRNTIASESAPERECQCSKQVGSCNCASKGLTCGANSTCACNAN